MFYTRNLPRQFAIILASMTNSGSDDSKITNKKPFVLLSEHSQVSEINAALI